MISKLSLKNFAAFTDLEIEFSRGINIIIGENGTGKTQLLKAIHALCGREAYGQEPGKQLTRKLCRLYQPLNEQVGGLRRSGTRGQAVLSATFGLGQEVRARFKGSETEAKVRTSSANVIAPAIFIPTKEVLSLVRGLTAEKPDQLTIERIFDDGYLDLAHQLIKEGVDDLDAKVQLNPRFDQIVPRLANLIGGRYLLEGGRFVFEPGQYEAKKAPTRSKAAHAQMYQDGTEWRFVPISRNRLSSSMTAEGFRKIGVLQRLLSNDGLNPGTTGPLLWDEPESNLNPKLMKELVLALLELGRNGQQVILATHDYVLLKWFDLLMDRGAGDHVHFHRLYREVGSDNLQMESQSDYGLVARSAISGTFAELYDEDVKRALGGD